MAKIAAGAARPKHVDIFWIRWLDVDDFFPAGSLAARRISKLDHIHRRCVFASCKTKKTWTLYKKVYPMTDPCEWYRYLYTWNDPTLRGLINHGC